MGKKRASGLAGKKASAIIGAGVAFYLGMNGANPGIPLANALCAVTLVVIALIIVWIGGRTAKLDIDRVTSWGIGMIKFESHTKIRAESKEERK